MPGSAPKEKSAHAIAEFQRLYKQGRTLPKATNRKSAKMPGKKFSDNHELNGTRLIMRLL
jgi:hypothetical protein